MIMREGGERGKGEFSDVQNFQFSAKVILLYLYAHVHTNVTVYISLIATFCVFVDTVVVCPR